MDLITDGVAVDVKVVVLVGKVLVNDDVKLDILGQRPDEQIGAVVALEPGVGPGVGDVGLEAQLVMQHQGGIAQRELVDERLEIGQGQVHVGFAAHAQGFVGHG